MRFMLPLLILPALFRPCAAQCALDDLTKILASDGDSSDSFGKSVAMSGHRAVVGAKGDEWNGIVPGSAYFFEFTGGSWVETQKVFAGDAGHTDNFGWSVAMEGDRAVIGAPFGGNGDGGAAYVFEFDGTEFVEIQRLEPSDPAASDTFGWSVALHGDVVIVGAPNKDGMGNNQGAAYVYRKTGSVWVQASRLTASDAVDSARFGYAVAAGATHVAVGAPFRGSGGPGPDPAVYFYQDNGTTWDGEEKITHGGEAADDWFGGALAMDGDRLAVGASHDDAAGADAGAVYLFEKAGSSWFLMHQLIGGAVAGDVLGNAVALRGSYLVAGALGHAMDGVTSGGAVVFRDVGAVWVGESIYPPDPVHLGFFGSAVAVSGDQVLAAAIGVSDLGSGAGAVYSYTVPDLAFGVSTNAAQVGDPVTLFSCGGRPGNPLALFVVAVNGQPLSSRLITGVFDAEGHWSVTSGVPDDPGLIQTSVTFRCYAISPASKIVQSADATIAFLP